MARSLSRPTRSVISAHCAAVRWSFQSSAGRMTRSAASRNTDPCIWPVSPMPATFPSTALATSASTLHDACHQSSGFCSVHPGRGVSSGYSWAAAAMTSPDSLTASALAPLVPMSRPISVVNSGISTHHLRLPRWVRACACAGDRTGQAGKFESRLELLRFEAETWTDGVVIVKPRQERGPKGVAGAAGVDDFNAWRVDVHASPLVGAERTASPKRHDHHTGAFAKNLFRATLVVEPCVDPGKVGLTRLHDGAL